MYLHSAITSNGFIDLQLDNGESKILDVVSNLPNQSLWMKYIQTDDHQIEAHQVETDAEKPKVYIQINGGICYWNSEGDVDVHVIDFDNTPDASIPDAFKHLSENLKFQ